MYTVDKKKVAFIRDNDKRHVEADDKIMLAKGYLPSHQHGRISITDLFITFKSSRKMCMFFKQYATLRQQLLNVRIFLVRESIHDQNNFKKNERNDKVYVLLFELFRQKQKS